MMLSPSRIPPALGVILPSSNRVVERVTRAMLEARPGWDACFARVPYAGHPADGYDLEPFQQAAALLAQARPDIILWNATRGALLGFEPDRQLCTLVERQTGIPCITTALATVELLRGRSLHRIGLLSQGDQAEASHLKQVFAREGIEIAGGQCLDITDNFQAADVSAEDIAARCGAIAGQSGLDAVLIWSTNLNGHGIADQLTESLGIPVLDSTTLGTRHALACIQGAGAPVV